MLARILFVIALAKVAAHTAPPAILSRSPVDGRAPLAAHRSAALKHPAAVQDRESALSIVRYDILNVGATRRLLAHTGVDCSDRQLITEMRRSSVLTIRS